MARVASQSAPRIGAILAWSAGAALLAFILAGRGSVASPAPPAPDANGPLGFALALAVGAVLAAPYLLVTRVHAGPSLALDRLDAAPAAGAAP